VEVYIPDSRSPLSPIILISNFMREAFGDGLHCPEAEGPGMSYSGGPLLEGGDILPQTEVNK
jgi:hypothetical protein